MGGPRKPEANRKLRGDRRFHRLLTLALEDNPEAVADLSRDFGFRYGVDES